MISQNALVVTTATGLPMENTHEENTWLIPDSLSRKIVQMGNNIWKAAKQLTGENSSYIEEGQSRILDPDQLKVSDGFFLSGMEEDDSLQIFEDVPPGHWAFAEIETLYRGGYVLGCSIEPRLYCPDSGLTRGEMAVFTLRGVNNAEFIPPDPTEQLFLDTPLSHWAVEWVTQLYKDEYSAGCSSDPLQFCTDTPHVRQEAAVFALRIVHGGDYIPPEPVGLFSDVDQESWSAKWVEQAYREGLLDACATVPDLLFCPESPFTRDWAAVLLVRALGLNPFPTPTPSATPTGTVQPTPTPTPDPSGDNNPVAVITMLSETIDHMDDFSNTHILGTKTIRFRIDDSYDPDGLTQLENGGSYYVRVHSRRFLGCGIVWREGEQGYADIKDHIFEVNLDDIGYYSIELTVTDSTGREASTRFYFYTMVSPAGLGAEPLENHPPNPEVTVVNASGGTGSRSNPYIINGNTARFNFLNSSDLDGPRDLQQGLFAYQIDADGMHPTHASGYTYQDMKNQDFSFDVGEIGSEHEFTLDAYVIDRWGRVNDKTFYFYAP